MAYPVAMSVLPDGEACRLDSMDGRAVTTTVTPSTSMNWTRQSAATARDGDRGPRLTPG